MYEVLKVPYRNIWLVLRDGEILDGYASADLANAYVRYMGDRA